MPEHKNPALSVPCRRCGAQPGVRCWDLTTATREFHTQNPHAERVDGGLMQDVKRAAYDAKLREMMRERRS